MPLVRFSVRNEYGLGCTELYKDGVKAEDPKAALDGIAVAGLVGILRQLGDLAQFAAEVFHGLQEQVASTASRSRKLVARVQRVEALLPTLEKAILSQTSHIHFAYTRGSQWHARIGNEQNHFICNDLPEFIMDSYEECRESPRLQLLDRFDTGGPGSCLKRYSDPTFFRRASANFEVLDGEKSQWQRKARKLKRRRSLQQSERFRNHAPISNGSNRMQLSSPTHHRQSSLSPARSTFDTTLKSDIRDQTDSLGSRDGMGFIECVFHPNVSVQSNKAKTTELSSGQDEETVNTTGETTIPHSSSINWDEKTEIIEPMNQSFGIDDIRDVSDANFGLHEQELKPVNAKCFDQVDDLSEHGSTPKSNIDENYPKTIIDWSLIEPNGQAGGIDEVEDMLETDFNSRSVSKVDDLSEDGRTPKSNVDGLELKPINAICFNQVDDLSEHGSTLTSNIDENYPKTTINWSFMDRNGEDGGINEVQDMLEIDFDAKSVNKVDDLSEDGSTPTSNIDENYPKTVIDWSFMEPNGQDCAMGEVQDMVETDFNAKSVDDVDNLSEDGSTPISNVDRHYPKAIIDRNFTTGLDYGIDEVQDMFETNFDLHKHDLELAHMEGCSQAPDLFEGGKCSELISDRNLINDPTDRKLGTGEVQNALEANFDIAEQELEAIDTEHVSQVDAFSDGGNTTRLIEWNHFDDIESETDNYVDALNTIETESESEWESQTNRDLELSSTSKDELVENTINEQKAEKISREEPESACHSPSNDHMEGLFGESLHSAHIQSIENAQLSCKEVGAVVGQELDDSLCSSDERYLQSTESSHVPNSSEGVDFCANVDGIIREPAVSEFGESVSQVSPDESTICTPHVPQEMPVGSSSIYPVSFWTNGTLLGLEPSKPTVFGSSSTGSLDPVRSGHDGMVCQSNQTVTQNVDGSAITLTSSVKDSESGDGSKELKLDNDDQDVGCSNHISPEKSEKKHESVYYDQNNLVDHDLIHGPSNGIVMPHEIKAPAGADVKNVSTEASNTSGDKSSLLSLLGHGLLNDGLRKAGLLGCDEKPMTSSPLKVNEFKNRCHTETDLKGKLGSPLNSPPPSPPVEHMKISFRLIHGFETSRLKLKYPEGVDHQESTLDTFASFQLVPGPTTLQHDMYSDSDDDTFCRSYACMSDDCLSHLSDSDSEQWEGDTSENNDHAFYDSLRRKSWTESTSSSLLHEEITDRSLYVGSGSVPAVNSLSGPSCHLPSFDAKNPFTYEEMKLFLNPELDSSHFQDPPPLPPVQWRVSKLLLDAAEAKEASGSNSLNQSFDRNLPGSGIPHLAKVDSAKLLSRTEESFTIRKTNKLDEQKLDGQKQNHQVANRMRVDDKEDLLHQIRTKSFNLRRTETARSTYTPNATTSNKITAILQKANAIRKVVGSDDGENDSWSDT